MYENFAIKGGVRRLMANAILNFHFDYLNPSLRPAEPETSFQLIPINDWDYLQQRVHDWSKAEAELWRLYPQQARQRQAAAVASLIAKSWTGLGDNLGLVGSPC